MTLHVIANRDSKQCNYLLNQCNDSISFNFLFSFFSPNRFDIAISISVQAPKPIQLKWNHCADQIITPNRQNKWNLHRVIFSDPFRASYIDESNQNKSLIIILHMKIVTNSCTGCSQIKISLSSKTWYSVICVYSVS